jgi:adenylate kinase
MEHTTNTIKEWLGTGALNIFGLPFAGKDTQAKLLAELFNGVVLSGGDILRHSDNQELQRIMAAGEIIPSSLWEQIVVPVLSSSEYADRPLILSEVGRLEGEQYVIERASTMSGHPQKAVVLLHLSDDEVWRRFDASQKEGDRGARADDNRDVIQTRLDSYHQKVMPVIEYYRSKGVLIEVDGSQSRQEVTAEILQKLTATAAL